MPLIFPDIVIRSTKPALCDEYAGVLSSLLGLPSILTLLPDPTVPAGGLLLYWSMATAEYQWYHTSLIHSSDADHHVLYNSTAINTRH